jgi:deoxyribonuclease-4
MVARRAKFGVAGNPPNFFKSSFAKDRSFAPQWLHEIGLDALEIQCTYGIRMPDERVKAFHEQSKRYDIALSIHGPYYINIGSSHDAGISRSEDELTKAVELAKRLGSTRVIFHPGGISDSRRDALDRAKAFLARFEKQHDCGDVRLFPETAGKVGQLGSLDDILALCESCSIAYPCLDLAHLHARTHGSLRTKVDFENVISSVEAHLGSGALKYLHVHLYPVAWGDGGEIGHKAFFDRLESSPQGALFGSPEDKDVFFRPRYEEFVDVVCDKRLVPTIICEAKDSQDLGAKEMKEYYQKRLAACGTQL